MNGARRLSLALALLWTGFVGSAAAESDATSVWSFKTPDVVRKGEPGNIILFPQKDVTDVTLTLTAGKQKVVLRPGRLEGGKEHPLSFKTPPGVTKWHAVLSGRSGGPPITVEFDFELAALDPLDVRLDRGGVNLPAGRVVAVANRPLAKARVQVFDKKGEQVVDSTLELPEVPAGQPNKIEWAETGPDIRRVDLELTDTFGLWTLLRAVSWYIEIPHDDVVFESGRWDVRPTESPKLDHAVGEIARELDRFREELGREAAVDAALYVAGHTDTVGGPGDNLTLSEKRARAIAEYLRGKGVKVPVYYLGVGEAGLAVDTPDDTDEARNRRAVYVLSNAAPAVGHYARGGWKKL
ncbi:MAG: OmpA family protein [Bradymonadia bacterium]|jgi:outer membrane protein OmpA-like peptidoglycan-associated protein